MMRYTQYRMAMGWNGESLRDHRVEYAPGRRCFLFPNDSKINSTEGSTAKTGFLTGLYFSPGGMTQACILSKG